MKSTSEKEIDNCFGKYCGGCDLLKRRIFREWNVKQQG